MIRTGERQLNTQTGEMRNERTDHNPDSRWNNAAFELFVSPLFRRPGVSVSAAVPGGVLSGLAPSRPLCL
jgi:hypothetical protein